jgi:flavin reductase (DIM6/NTAB) family NADH-FMN oxidoreductase RutF
MLIKTDDFDKTLKLISPHYYALLVTLNKNEKPNVMGISWFMFTSFSPPKIAISVGNTRYSFKNLKEVPEFTLCFPTSEITEKAMKCGYLSGEDTDKIKKLEIEIIKSQKVKPPIIKDSIVAYECQIIDSFATGDHTIFIGKIVNYHCDYDAKDHIYVKNGFEEPIAIKYDYKP